VTGSRSGSGGRAAPLRLGTRRSRLAMSQARTVADALVEHTGARVELVEIVTEGDRSPLAVAQLGGTGVFVSALRDALRAGRIDLAVHSLKDLPTAPDDDVVLAAVPPRADPRDALCCPSGWTLGELPPGTLVGTGSPRRAAQLRALGQELDVVTMRGNVDTRLRKVEAGDVEAVVLARAGLARIGRLDAVTEVIDPLQMLPAPGQGALAVECRASDDAFVATLAAALDDSGSRAAVAAERAFLAAVEAGCTAPVGALADVADDELYLRGVIASLDGEEVFRQSMTGAISSPEEIGRRLAEEMLTSGAADVLASSSLGGPPKPTGEPPP
jgi:hydroxymethylbilane synthase